MIEDRSHQRHSDDSIAYKQPIERARPKDILVFLLSSGQMLKVRGVKLFPVEIVTAISQLRQSAATKLGGVSTGIGFIGSPGWAIGAGAALGLLEGALSSVARKEGVRLLAEAEQKHLDMVRAAKSFPVSLIINRDQPNPAHWQVEIQGPRRIEVANMSRSDLGNVLLRYKKDKSHITNGMLDVIDTHVFVHDGGEFLIVETDLGDLHIRWPNVVAFSLASE